MKRLFISKNTSEIKALVDFLVDRNETIVNHSFLSFEPIDFEAQSQFDVIFFSSPRAVIFYKAKQDIPKDTLIACTGIKTAELLKAMGYQIDFIGEKSGDINTVAQSFKTWAGDKKVLFPISSISLKSISSVLNAEQVIELEVYKTSIQAKEIETCETYVFTSPSNVEGFLLKNSIPPKATVIAWGSSTETKLLEAGVPVNHTLGQSSISELINFLN